VLWSDVRHKAHKSLTGHQKGKPVLACKTASLVSAVVKLRKYVACALVSYAFL
jgi:hypothetical protein